MVIPKIVEKNATLEISDLKINFEKSKKLKSNNFKVVFLGEENDIGQLPVTTSKKIEEHDFFVCDFLIQVRYLKRHKRFEKTKYLFQPVIHSKEQKQD